MGGLMRLNSAENPEKLDHKKNVTFWASEIKLPLIPQILNPLLNWGGEFRRFKMVPFEIKVKVDQQNGTFWD